MVTQRIGLNRVRHLSTHMYRLPYYNVGYSILFGRDSKKIPANFFSVSEIILTFVDRILKLRTMSNRNIEDYFVESRRLRALVMAKAKELKGNPITFVITNGITMHVEITNSDLRVIANKNTRNNKFNAIKNALAMDIKGYLEKAEYVGWRPTVDGKHFESAYFTYFSRDLGCKTILCMRKMRVGGIYKPYAIIDEYTFEARIDSLVKGTPP